ncbi:hypothetical protein BTUL_0053g00490 [Botrytis tulipae]|uniref:Aminoglycoside phosphotransferase domain-containing protein n=1 Tax=Botrytis tulipae TaxID=87230 RepID=A0A4Z1ESS5_9HELO|nr:hypothetical protein BTUL_0053g00490 [Botrytis tulipae]
MDSRSSSLTSGITFNNVQIRDSICDPYLDALVECYKDGNNSRLDESHANGVGNIGTENFDPPDHDFIHGDIVSDNSFTTNKPSTESSTYMYEQEPFDTYRTKVNQLLWPTINYRAYGWRKFQSGDWLVVPNWLLDSATYSTGPGKMAEIIMWLQRFAFLRVPKVLAIDTTTENSLKSPFVLQERVQGIPLDDLFFEIPTQLPMSTRLEVVKAVAKFIIKLERTTLDKPGRLVGIHTVPWTSTSMASSTPRIEFDSFAPNFMESAPPFEEELPSLLFNLMTAHHDFRTEEMLVVVLREMDERQFFKSSDSTNVLWHWDLQPRHIFVEKSESGQWEVSGVIDWDDVNSMPLVLTRAPRYWLWFYEECFEYASYFTHPWDSDYDAPVDLPLNKDVTIVKEYFDRIMQETDPTYMDDTYGRGHWIRRLVRLARVGLDSPWDLERLDQFINDWDDYTGALGSIYGEYMYHILLDDGTHL